MLCYVRLSILIMIVKWEFVFLQRDGCLAISFKQLGLKWYTSVPESTRNSTILQRKQVLGLLTVGFTFRPQLHIKTSTSLVLFLSPWRDFEENGTHSSSWQKERQIVQVQKSHEPRSRPILPHVARPDNIRIINSSATQLDSDSAVPRPLTKAEIRQIIAEYVQALFDEVEIHGAEGAGYPIDQCTQGRSRARDDEKGGNFFWKSGALYSSIGAVVDVIGGERVRVRLSPWQIRGWGWRISFCGFCTFLLGNAGLFAFDWGEDCCWYGVWGFGDTDILVAFEKHLMSDPDLVLMVFDAGALWSGIGIHSMCRFQVGRMRGYPFSEEFEGNVGLRSVRVLELGVCGGDKLWVDLGLERLLPRENYKVNRAWSTGRTDTGQTSKEDDIKNHGRIN